MPDTIQRRVPLIFPPNPADGDTYAAPNGVTYRFDGVVWLAEASFTPGGGIPEAPVDGAIYGRGGQPDATWATVLALAGGSMTGQVIQTLSPVDRLHLANKGYVDDGVASIDLTPYLPLAGGDMTGFLSLAAEPTDNAHAATKLYVDTLAATGSVYLGTWEVAANEPDISGTAFLAGSRRMCVTLDPDAPEIAPGGILGLTGRTIAYGDFIIWDGALVQWDLIPAGGMTKAEADTLYVGLVGDRMTGPLYLSEEPTTDDQAATKRYVDGNAGGIVEPPIDPNTYGRVNGPPGRWQRVVNLDGDTMFGPLTLSGPPTDASHAASKAYVDASTPAGGPWLPLSGGLLSGNLQIQVGSSSTGSGQLQILGSQAAFIELYTLGSPGGTFRLISYGNDRGAIAHRTGGAPTYSDILGYLAYADPGSRHRITAGGNLITTGDLTVQGAGAFNSNVSAPQAPTTGAHLVNKTYVDTVVSTGSFYQGTWDVALNNPPLNGNPPTPVPGTGYRWLCITADPDVPETAPADMPNVGGRTVYYGSFLIWDQGLAQWDLVSSSTLTKELADTLYVDIDGDTMTGMLSLFADPTQPMHAATMRYVEDLVGGQGPFLALTGGVLTGDLEIEPAAKLTVSAITGPVVLTGDFGVAGAVSVVGPVSIVGDVTAAGRIAGGELEIDGDATISGNITSSPQPTAPDHLTNKAYVDASQPIGAPFLPLAAGPTTPLADFLYLTGDAPTDALHAASKGYVDTQLAAVLGAVVIIGAMDASTPDAQCLFTPLSGLPDGPLPAASAVPPGGHLIVASPGTPTTGPVAGMTFEAGDWVVSDGVDWFRLALGGATQLASGILLLPPVFGATDVQRSLQNAEDTLLPLTAGVAKPLTGILRIENATSSGSPVQIATGPAPLYPSIRFEHTPNTTFGTFAYRTDQGGRPWFTSSSILGFTSTDAANPTYGTRSTGTRIVLYDNLSASAADFALGIAGGTLWFSVPQPSHSFRWFGGTTEWMRMSSGEGLYVSVNHTVVGNVRATQEVIAQGGSRLIGRSSDNTNGTWTTMHQGRNSADQWFYYMRGGRNAINGSTNEGLFDFHLACGGWGDQAVYNTAVGAPPGVYFNGNISVLGLTNRSARRFKNSIREVRSNEVVTAWAALNPVRYRDNDPPPPVDDKGVPLANPTPYPEQRLKWGFIADDIAADPASEPLAVYEGPKGTSPESLRIVRPVEGYDLAQMLTLTIARMKQMEAEIAELRAMIPGGRA